MVNLLSLIIYLLKTCVFSDRLQWVAHVEFSNKEIDITSESADGRLPRTEKLRSMVKQGIPHSLRPQIWMRLSGKPAHKSRFLQSLT